MQKYRCLWALSLLSKYNWFVKVYDKDFEKYKYVSVFDWGLDAYSREYIIINEEKFTFKLKKNQKCVNPTWIRDRIE